MGTTGFSADERAAMRQRADEIRATKGLKGAAKKAQEYEACIAAIDALEGVDSEVATLLHRVVTEEAAHLDPKTWYGFPTYAKDGKVIVFYQPASKFDTRYGTVGFQDAAALDDGDMWPTVFAVVAVTDAVEKKLRALVKKASG
ncbi:hypothetical protein GCM10009808_09100 [Microbacterium sediminicola]|uniref:DUF1801 domain-containing protein n=1 Tax=Microbacterium sediminicola TaxID=415210 RepID=A0ABP4TUM8_9MICO